MNTNTKLFFFLISCLLLSCVGIHLWHYLLFPNHAIIGLCILPLVISFNQTEKKVNYWYLITGILLALTSLSIHLVTLYYFSIVFSFLLILQLLTKSNNHLILFLFAVISPAFTYLKNAIGIPIRLFLSDISSSLLSGLQGGISLKGNLVTIGHDAFMIDQACAGLNMLTYTFIIGILIMALVQSNKKATWSFWQSLGLMILLLCLSILSNLSRILILIQFRILPDNQLHYYTGIICMLLVAISPFAIICLYFGSYLKETNQKLNLSSISNKTIFISSLFVTMIFTIGFWVKSTVHFKPYQTIFKPKVPLQKTLLKYGVTKFSNDSILVYEKPLNGFYSAEHSPMICWKGSGYQFENIDVITINKRQYYYALLKNEDNDVLHTAWWFQSKTFQTIDQLSWRMHCFRTNENFSLINVTFESKKELIKFLGESN